MSTSQRPRPGNPVSPAELSAWREKISQLVLKHPGKAAVILAEWINLPAKKSTLKKAG